MEEKQHCHPFNKHKNKLQFLKTNTKLGSFNSYKSRINNYCAIDSQIKYPSYSYAY